MDRDLAMKELFEAQIPQEIKDDPQRLKDYTDGAKDLARIFAAFFEDDLK